MFLPQIDYLARWSCFCLFSFFAQEPIMWSKLDEQNLETKIYSDPFRMPIRQYCFSGIKSKCVKIRQVFYQYPLQESRLQRIVENLNFPWYSTFLESFIQCSNQLFFIHIIRCIWYASYEINHILWRNTIQIHRVISFLY